MGEIDDLVDQYGVGNVKKAFWLQDKIRDDGLEGIHFMDHAEGRAKNYASLVTYQAIRSELHKRF